MTSTEYKRKGSLKADSKGRIVGFTPGAEYHVSQAPDGSIEATPVIPEEFDDVREISESDLKQVFGVTPSEIAIDYTETFTLSNPGEGFYPGAILFHRFPKDENGDWRWKDAGGRITERVLIKVRKDM